MTLERFAVMLEGREADQAFFITMTVDAARDEDAVRIAQEEARSRGLRIIRIEEVELTGTGGRNPGIKEVSGKSFFG